MYLYISIYKKIIKENSSIEGSDSFTPQESNKHPTATQDRA